MLSLIDCLDFIDLDHTTVEVIAEHENIPMVLAVELGNQLLADLRGIWVIHDMHRDLIARAAEAHDLEREQRLRLIYTAFSRKYPMPNHL